MILSAFASVEISEDFYYLERKVLTFKVFQQKLMLGCSQHSLLQLPAHWTWPKPLPSRASQRSDLRGCELRLQQGSTTAFASLPGPRTLFPGKPTSGALTLNRADLRTQNTTCWKTNHLINSHTEWNSGSPESQGYSLDSWSLFSFL